MRFSPKPGRILAGVDHKRPTLHAKPKSPKTNSFIYNYTRNKTQVYYCVVYSFYDLPGSHWIDVSWEPRRRK